MSEVLINKEITDYIFKSETNRKIFSEYLKNYFIDLGDIFWSKYYIHSYQPLMPLTGHLDINSFHFCFHKISGSNYKSEIIYSNNTNNIVRISPFFNNMQHYRCKDIKITELLMLFTKMKRNKNLSILLDKN